MPNSIISEGKTTNEAIENGLKKLNVTKKQVNIKILENEDKRSFFSILSPRVVKVELTLKENTTHENDVVKTNNDKIINKTELKTYSEEDLNKAEKNAREFLDSFLGKIGKGLSFEIIKNEKGLNININGEDASFLIGYRGDTLYALQIILSAISSRGLSYRIRVILDISGYKQKREDSLKDLADKLERTVIRTGKPVTLEPMKAYERKIIHTRLQNSKKVVTNSIGEEPKRRIVISLK